MTWSGGTTAVFTVLVAVPVAFVQLPAVRQQQLLQLRAGRSTCSLFPRLGDAEIKRLPGIYFFVFSIHLIVVTRGSLVLDCLLQITHIIPTGSEIIH